MKAFAKSNSPLVAATPTLLATFDVTELKALAIHLANTGNANPLIAFEIRGKSCPDGDYVSLASSGFMFVDYWTRWANVDPTSLAPNAKALVHISVEELNSVQVYATSANGTNVSITAGGFGETR